MAFDHIIATHPVLRQLQPEQIKTVASLSREVVHSRRQVIYREGESTQGIFLVISGYIKLLRTSSDGKELLLGLAGPDDLFGSCCQPMVPCINPCVAEARTVSKVIFLPHPSWQWLLKNRTDIAHVYLQALMDARQGCTALAADLAFLSLEARLAKLLLYLSRFSRPRSNGDIEVPKILSQWELASAIGTAREVVTRKVQTMVDEGVLARRGRQIVIRDPLALKQTALSV